ncbi:MAG: murein hydrolase activator EnvC family protein [Candidatus Eiseniibacteriota bacterium]
MRAPFLAFVCSVLLVGAVGTVGTLAVVGLGAHTFGATPAFAQEEMDEEAQRKELERIRKEAAEKRRRAQELKARESKVLKELRTTETRLRNTRKNIGQLTRREEDLEQQLGVVRGELERSQSALRDQRSRLAERLRNLYKYGRARELEFFLSAQSFAQLLTRFDFLTRVARLDRRILLGITEEKEKIEWNQKRLDRTHQQVDRTLDLKQREQKRLDRLAVNKKASVTKIQTERQEYEAAAAELEQTARRIQTLLADLERRRREEEERRRAQAGEQVPVPPAPYEGDFERAKGQLDWPLRGELAGQFGNEKHPRFGTVTFNNGIDVRASQGEAIRAVAAGRVDFTSDDYGSYGQMVILNHGSGYYTLYAHCSDVLVSRGQQVSGGQTIARAGDSGSLKGTILHFEVRKGRTALNPLEWLR